MPLAAPGCLWLSQVASNCLQLLLVLALSGCLCMPSSVFGMSLGASGCLWLPLAASGCLKLPLTASGFLCPSLAVFGLLWLRLWLLEAVSGCF